MWLELTTSPSTSRSGTTRVSKRSSPASSAGSPLALWPKRKFSPTETCVALQRVDEDLVDELGGGLGGALAVEGHDHDLLDAEIARQPRLALERGQQARRARRVQDRDGMGLEGHDRVRAGDHLAVADVDAVERADGHAARAGLGVGQADDPGAHPRKPTTGLSPPSRGSAMATGPSSSTSRTSPASVAGASACTS